MNDAHLGSSDSASLPPRGQHLTTLSHEGRFWDAYLEFDDDPSRPDGYRARFVFSPGDPGDHEGLVRTAVIIIEDSFEAAVRKARSFNDRQLGDLLRSCLD
jgi:hypothetical protein